MKKKKGMARVLLSLVLISSMIMNVFAVDSTTGTVSVETTGGNYENVNVVISIEKVEHEDDSVSTQTTGQAEDFVTGDGMIVDYEESSDMLTDGNNVTTGESESEYSVLNSDATYGAEGGSETTSEKGNGAEGASNVTVDVPLTSEDDPKTETTENQNTAEKIISEVVTGDPKEYPEDGEYDYTTTTTSSQVTVTTNEITITETPVEKVVDENGNVIEGTDLDYVVSEVDPSKGNGEDEVDNDLIVWIYRGNRLELPQEGEEIVVNEGYEYKYLGADNTSQYLPTFLYKSPDPENPDEEPAYTDAEGNHYYLRGRNGSSFNDVYHDGEKSAVEEGYQSVFTVPQQFLLVDAATGELITTYCADADTATVQGYNYNVENLEDADYYNDEQAAMIRTIAANGYWGAVGTEINENGDEVPVTGSLEAMKQMLLDSGKFSEEELEHLTDGLALSATQMAIWTFSNAMSDMEFLNVLYTKDGNNNNEIATSWAGQLLTSTIPEGKKDGMDLLYKVYDYMINMVPSQIEEPTTSDTIINADNFLEDMSVTVIEKIEDHTNNQDDDDTNDAYITNLTFALVVTPSTENGDDLIVKVLDAQGNELASGRIAGELRVGEEYVDYDEATGNYSFKDIVMVEGEQNFNITLEGVQNLKEGVYLYTSEILEDTSSQTMVGIAKGEHAVDVSMNINFELSVEDEIVVTEHIWRDEWYDDGDDEEEEKVEKKEEETPPSPPGGEEEVEEIPEPDIPLSDIEIPEEVVEELLEEEIPLANVPKTGDVSALWMALTVLSGSGLLGLTFMKKREED